MVAEQTGAEKERHMLKIKFKTRKRGWKDGTVGEVLVSKA